MTLDHRNLAIDIDRLYERIEALGAIGAVTGPAGERGCARLALTDADRDGRDLVVSWMHDLGLEVVVDAIGNVFATRAGSDPTLAPVMTGSHIDTVGTGGRFDGNLGVLAGLEVIETLMAHDVSTQRAITVAFFTNEEGARFAPDMLGSLVHVGGMSLEDALDITATDDGAKLGDELIRIGYAGPVPCPGPSAPDSFVELHIEQGPILEAEGITIGIVEGVQGISWKELTITGRSAHAGTTPMNLRRDPLYAAAVIATFVREVTRRLGAGQVGTVGRFDVVPDLVNVVPAKVTMTVDLRNTDDRRLRDAERRVAELCEQVATDEQVTIETRTLARFEPVDFDVDLTAQIETVAHRLGYSTRRLPSGAGHDAQMLARVCPSAMIFVPSIGGLSHNLAEDTAIADLEAGSNVLLQILLERCGVSPS